MCKTASRGITMGLLHQHIQDRVPSASRDAVLKPLQQTMSPKTLDCSTNAPVHRSLHVLLCEVIYQSFRCTHGLCACGCVVGCHITAHICTSPHPELKLLSYLATVSGWKCPALVCVSGNHQRKNLTCGQASTQTWLLETSKELKATGCPQKGCGHAEHHTARCT